MLRLSPWRPDLGKFRIQHLEALSRHTNTCGHDSLQHGMGILLQVFFEGSWPRLDLKPSTTVIAQIPKSNLYHANIVLRIPVCERIPQYLHIPQQPRQNAYLCIIAYRKSVCIPHLNIFRAHTCVGAHFRAVIAYHRSARIPPIDHFSTFFSRFGLKPG